MGKGKDITAAEKQKITKLLSEGMSTLETTKELCSYRKIEKATER